MKYRILSASLILIMASLSLTDIGSACPLYNCSSESPPAACFWRSGVISSCNLPGKHPLPLSCACEVGACPLIYYSVPSPEDIMDNNSSMWLPRPSGACEDIPCGECYEFKTTQCREVFLCQNEYGSSLCHPTALPCDFYSIGWSTANYWVGADVICCYDLN